ncbi:uncharacterized protein [Aristolochia californica]|uniref:uncharacterized protein n=1 Tax=Aristolochia californica TaxID=171875 RepID=UPI0035DF7CE3
MDFDEYDYLEKTVENPDLPKGKEAANGDALKADKDRSRSSKQGGNRDLDRDGRSKRSRGENDAADNERAHRRNSSQRRSSPEQSLRDDRDRHRGGGERRERDKERERERDKEREREREKEKERAERNGKDRERERDRERDKGRESERDKEKNRARERERESKEKEREREQERERRGRSMSRSERQREELEKDGERTRDKELKENEKEKEFKDRDRERDVRRYREKKEEVAEPEADPERDQRTVFAYQICLKADERDVYEFFSRAGKVRDVRLIMDRNSRRSKGVGYIEFYDVMSVPMAIALSGQLLLGQPVMVKPSEAEKNLVQSTTTAAGAAGARRLYVGNLHFNITEEQLRQVFEPFGSVELVQLPLDPETGQCKGFGFVQFARLEDSKAAQSLNGQLDIAGRIIKVSAVTDQVGMQDVGANAADFDDDDGGGLSLNARSRAILMQKLDRSGTATSFAGSLGNPVVNGTSLPPVAPVLGVSPAIASLAPSLGQASVPQFGVPGSALSVGSLVAPSVSAVVVPTECLLLTNMFDPKIETEADFDMEIKEDVLEECSKFGMVHHIHVDKNSDGHVYLRFDAATSALSAQRALHGRWFAGKQISATFMLPANYEAKFPDSK